MFSAKVFVPYIRLLSNQMGDQALTNWDFVWPFEQRCPADARAVRRFAIFLPKLFAMSMGKGQVDDLRSAGA
jgi:hypothetical protein